MTWPGPIAPHGGKLVNRIAPPEDLGALRDKARTLPTVTADEWIRSDLELLGTGAVSPLEGFMGAADYRAVLDEIRLDNGLVWGIPVTLRLPREETKTLHRMDEVAFIDDRSGQPIAIMAVEEVYETDVEEEAQKVFGTTDLAHPGVQRLQDLKDTLCVAGPVTLIGPIPHEGHAKYRLGPREIRAAFDARGWKTAVAFQTRNPIHRAHEYITKVALEGVDGLLIHPLMGFTKPGDIPAPVRLECYEVMMEKYYVPERVMLSFFPAAMRYGGPREAIFHALCRKNYGCTHFIVGRDHAGVGSYYGTFDAQKIFERFTAEEIGITPLKFEHSFYCKRTNQMATVKTSPAGKGEKIFLSGTKVREMLSQGQLPPPEFSRPEVAQILMRHYRSL